ncbi:MAG TPA: hypothetical protein PLZ84_00520 [Clostridia bacterium]|nr:hypothetical protein [Clostridia bacterium]
MKLAKFAAIALVLFIGCLFNESASTAHEAGAAIDLAVLIRHIDSLEEPAPALPEGITVAQLKKDLLTHTELIPFEGVLGGTPIYFGDTFRCLPGHHVFIYAEDGHICADMILSYEINKDKSINWKLVAYNLNAMGWKTVNE